MEKIDLAQFQKFYLQSFKDLALFCDKNNIEYSLAFGTMLGAVRDKKIIDWDYDIDLYISDDNLNKLITLEKDLPKNFFLKTYKRNEEYFGLTRIYIKNLFRQEKKHSVRNAYIDLFNYSQVSLTNPVKIIKKQKKLFSKTCFRYSNDIPKSKIKKFLKPLIKLLCPTLKSFNNKCYKLFKNDNKCKEVTILYFPLIKNLYLKNFELKTVNFSNIKCKCFKDFDYLLRTIYGNNYMVPIKYQDGNDLNFYVE